MRPARPLGKSPDDRSPRSFRAAGRWHGLDTLRALAILLVMPFHLSDHLPGALQPASRFGWIGVDLFFVLSGFLIGAGILRSYQAGRRFAFGEFWRRRAFRILPAYAVVLLLYVVVPVWREAPGMQPPWQFATFTENFLIDYRVHRAFSHAWSLCVEEHFYLVLPVVTALLMRRPSLRKAVAALVSTVVFGMVVRACVLAFVLRPMGTEADDFSVTYIQLLYYPTYARLDGLAAGVALALLVVFRPVWWASMARRGHWLSVGGVALIGAALWSSTERTQSVTGKTAFFDVAG